ncbi:MAG: bifunctional 5,10-methylenetetrahydrofolate dehydrogenase/5,10-methenyltetrahydrofolate cyclohydrolase [Candidatus Nomurabacteria bacterium]|nr:bifunctional 5,10-methylenetetrahydrofolate dehydrogenase/5,10-methenyltetrahydrofolate cyclohydrolase [Candidatus Nomurabacteria bacterium]
MQIIDGRKIKEEILKELKKKVEALSFPPIFCDILVGDDTVSASYVRIKEKAAESIGIKFKAVKFPLNVSTEEILEEIDNLNRVPLLCGIIIQLPLPPHIDKQTVLDAIDPSLDVDCLGSFNNEIFYNIGGSIGYPTALACMKLLDSLNLDLENKNIVVLGRGKLVGLPVTHLLERRGLKVSVVHSQTTNAEDLISNADVIISAIGRGKYITLDMIKEGVVIIDAGTSEENGAVVGDVDMESVGHKASFMTPTPGGVGPVTVAMLLENVYKVAQSKIK